jgi:predicted porin
MKKYLTLFLCLLGTLAVHAQTKPAVPEPGTVYLGGAATLKINGIVDAGLTTATNVGTANSTATMFDSGAMETSRLRLIASEDLGGGTSASIVLEQQIASGTGTNGTSSSTGSVNAAFSRNSKFVLADQKFGTLTMGRQNSLIYKTFNIMDARADKNFGSAAVFWNDGSTFGGTSTTKTGLSTINGGSYWSGAVRYDLPVINGLQISGQYVPGGSATDSTYSSRYALTADWKINDALTLVAGESKIYGTTGLVTGLTDIYGGRYTFGPNVIAIGRTVMKNPSTLGASNTSFYLDGFSVKRAMTPNFDISAGVYKLTDNISSKNGATEMAIVGDYYFSKNINFYVAVGQTVNKGTSGFAPFGGSGGANINSLSTTQYPSVVTVAGQTQKAWTIGVTTRF